MWNLTLPRNPTTTGQTTEPRQPDTSFFAVRPSKHSPSPLANWFKRSSARKFNHATPTTTARKSRSTRRRASSPSPTIRLFRSTDTRRPIGTDSRPAAQKVLDADTHKRQKLRETQDAYQQALQAAFAAGCDTRQRPTTWLKSTTLSGTETGDKKYVPRTRRVLLDADELHDNHPVRFTNEGLQLDHQPQNAIEWYVKIPHHEDYHLWIPARANPEQREWLEALDADDAEMGEAADRAGRNVVAPHHRTRDVEDHRGVRRRADTARRVWRALSRWTRQTPIGVDIGEAMSLVNMR